MVEERGGNNIKSKVIVVEIQELMRLLCGRGPEALVFGGFVYEWYCERRRRAGGVFLLLESEREKQEIMKANLLFCIPHQTCAL